MQYLYEFFLKIVDCRLFLWSTCFSAIEFRSPPTVLVSRRLFPANNLIPAHQWNEDKQEFIQEAEQKAVMLVSFLRCRFWKHSSWIRSRWTTPDYIIFPIYLLFPALVHSRLQALLVFLTHYCFQVNHILIFWYFHVSLQYYYFDFLHRNRLECFFSRNDPRILLSVTICFECFL